MTHRNMPLTSTFTSSLDNNLTEPLRSTRSQRAPKAGSSPLRLVLWGVLCINALSITSANANTIDTYKLYAHSRILDYKEFQCFNKIITKESRWSVTARNGSHYGLGQMRSTHYRDLDGFRQIDATIKYITNRYGSMCKALAHHKVRNYY